MAHLKKWYTKGTQVARRSGWACCVGHTWIIHSDRVANSEDYDLAEWSNYFGGAKNNGGTHYVEIQGFLFYLIPFVCFSLSLSHAHTQMY